ncbi:cryptococcal mannosyltransferase 1-domain-containing protein [Mycena epipterygia]|nr:cryptococcal mannosyltransferase 1-domain-containing protein [Mycena epipterygia]
MNMLPGAEQIFLAAMFYNNGGVLPYWITEVTKLIYSLGPDTILVSIVESNSGDNAALLEAFDRTLEAMGVARRALTHDTTIERPASTETGLPRITFLAAVRNLTMQPLNDVFIEAASIAELLDEEGELQSLPCDGEPIDVCAVGDPLDAGEGECGVREAHCSAILEYSESFLHRIASTAIVSTNPSPSGIAIVCATPLPSYRRRSSPIYGYCFRHGQSLKRGLGKGQQSIAISELSLYTVQYSLS